MGLGSWKPVFDTCWVSDTTNNGPTHLHYDKPMPAMAFKYVQGSQQGFRRQLRKSESSLLLKSCLLSPSIHSMYLLLLVSVFTGSLPQLM